jgi:hypothetical protein
VGFLAPVWAQAAVLLDAAVAVVGYAVFALCWTTEHFIYRFHIGIGEGRWRF